MLLALCIGAAVADPLTVDQVPSPRQRSSWVADVADVIDDTQEAAIDSIAGSLQADLGAEIAVVTVPDVEGTPKAFATALFNRWGVGDDTANNGVLVLLVVDARRVEIETGYGVEGILPDGWLGRMMDDAMVPRFKAGDLGQGLLDGVAAIDVRLRAHPEETRAGTGGKVELPPMPISSGNSGRGGGLALLAVGGSVPLVLIGGLVVYNRRRRRCPVCKREMTELSEVDDDAHLDEGQVKEEELGSVDYVVLVCDEHEQVRILPKKKAFSGYSRCKQCGYRTSKRRSHTLLYATYSHGGRVEITKTCEHCGFKWRTTRRTSRKTRSTSTYHSGGGGFHGGGGSSFGGGGGGGSFGGGHSGGGGAGRSW